MWFYSPPQREYDFLRIESKWQERWREARLFETDPDSRRPKFFITVPYPYTSGPLHIGHGRTYTLGDIFARYVRMKGYNTLFPMAFHITGTPILAIARRIASNHAGYRDLYREYVKIYVHEDSEIEKHLESFREPRPIADFFSKFISQDFQAMGYSIDWRRSFSTGDQDYQTFVTWQFKKLHDAGYLKQGKHPLLYCLTCQNAVGEDDIEDGDVIGAKVIQFVGVKFPAMDRLRELLVAATVRPETIYGCTNLWANPEADYVEAQVDGETWIVSEKAAEKLKHQDHDVQIRKRILGRELVGRTVQNPATRQSLIVLPADFVDDDSGTGVVYSVPAHAPYDLVALKDLAEDHARVIESGLRAGDVSRIEPLSIIEVQGYGDCPAAEVVNRVGVANQRDREHLDEATRVLYEAEFYHGTMRQNCGKFAGLPVSEAKDAVTKWLASIGNATTIFETSVKPVRCKDGGKVIAAVLGQQWFLNYGDPDWKKTARRALANMTIHPEVYRKLFENTFDWLDMRPCARRRGLGTPFPLEPAWIIESLSDSTIYMAFYTIIHHIRGNGVKPEQLTPDVFDYLFLSKGDPKQLSRDTGISANLLERMHEEFSYWYPVDLRHTGIGHITNHLSFYIFHHVAIFPPEDWPLKITLNEFLVSEGAKMSKSKGNVVPLAEVPRKYGADLVRLYMAYAADLATLMDWREQQLAAVRRSLGRYWRLAESMTYGETKEPSHLSFISAWMLSRVNSTVEEASSAISQHSFREYAQRGFFDFINLVENYTKWSADIEDAEKEFVLDYSASRWIRILAPLTPHVCEELWEKRGAEGFVSAAPWPNPQPARINRQVEAEMALVLRTIEDVKEISKVAKTKAAKLYVYVSPAWKFKVLQKMKDVGQDKSVKEIMTALMADPELKKTAKDVAGLVAEVKASRRTSDVMTQEREVQALMKAKNIVHLETGLHVDVIAVQGQVYDPKGKARTALPGRPALYLE